MKIKQCFKCKNETFTVLESGDCTDCESNPEKTAESDGECMIGHSFNNGCSIQKCIKCDHIDHIPFIEC